MHVVFIKKATGLFIVILFYGLKWDEFENILTVGSYKVVPHTKLDPKCLIKYHNTFLKMFEGYGINNEICMTIIN